MPTIGNTTIEPSGVYGLNEAYGFHWAAVLYTAAAGDVVTLGQIYGAWPGIPPDPSTAYLQLYEYSSGNITNAIGPPIPISISGAAGTAWHFSAVLNIPLTAGTTYTVVAYTTADYFLYVEGFHDTAMGTETPCPPSDPFNQTGTRASQKSFYLTVENSGPPPTSSIIFPCCAQLIS